MRVLLLFFIVTGFCGEALSGYSCPSKNIKTDSCNKLVKLNKSAALGKCLAKEPPSDISSVLQRNNIEAYTGPVPKSRRAIGKKSLAKFNDIKDSRIVALAKVVSAFEKISGDDFKPFAGKTPIQVIFANEKSTGRNSRRIGNQVHLMPGSQNASGTMGESTCGGVDNHGLIAHELAHFIGGHLGEEDKALVKYQKKMNGERCKLTSYSSKNLAEEFAEVIAAYVTMPQFLEGKGAACQKAVGFVKSMFGEAKAPTTCEERMASLESPQSYPNTQFVELLNSNRSSL